MFDNVNNTRFVYDGRRVRLVADDQRPLVRVIELSTGPAVLQHLVAKVFKQGLEIVPLVVSRWWCGAEPIECLLVLGHAGYIPMGFSVTAN